MFQMLKYILMLDKDRLSKCKMHFLNGDLNDYPYVEK